MSAKWKNGFPADLLRDLRPGGWCYGMSPNLPRVVRLHKTEISNDLKRLPAHHVLLWRIDGTPEQTGRYAKDRRSIIIWLGGK